MYQYQTSESELISDYSMMNCDYYVNNVVLFIQLHTTVTDLSNDHMHKHKFLLEIIGAL